MKKLVLSICVVMLLFLISIPVTAREHELLSEEIVHICYEMGEKYGVCPQLLMAIIEKESTGNPKAKNGVCVGLMQVNNKYSQEYMDQIGATDIYDIRTNIEVGTMVLMDKRKKADDDLEIALAMYNGQSNPNPDSEYVRWILKRSQELEEEMYGQQ